MAPAVASESPGTACEDLLAFDERENNEIGLDIGRRRRHETHCVASADRIID